MFIGHGHRQFQVTWSSSLARVLTPPSPFLLWLWGMWTTRTHPRRSLSWCSSTCMTTTWTSTSGLWGLMMMYTSRVRSWRASCAVSTAARPSSWDKQAWELGMSWVNWPWSLGRTSAWGDQGLSWAVRSSRGWCPTSESVCRRCTPLTRMWRWAGVSDGLPGSSASGPMR